MNSSLSHLSWDLVAVFLAVAETGSLSAAAHKLKQSQPTVGRHVKSMEDAVGVPLFHRHQRGLALTKEGESLLAPARSMQRAASHFKLQAEASVQQSEAGSVRLTASAVLSHYVLPRLLCAFRLAHPSIHVDLVPTDDTQNLLFQEADLAIRMYRPTQLDLITQKIGDAPLGVYASRSFVERYGLPETLDALMRLPWVGYDQSDLIIEGLNALGFSIDRSFFAVRCDERATYWELVRAGCGIGLGQTGIGDADPEMIALPISAEIPALPLWLTVPSALRHHPRIAKLFDFLAEHLPNAVANPGAP